jgi:hypothetical protein
VSAEAKGQTCAAKTPTEQASTKALWELVCEFATPRSLIQPSIDRSCQLNAGVVCGRTGLEVDCTTIQVRDLNILSERRRYSTIRKQPPEFALKGFAKGVPLRGLKTVEHQFFDVQLN